MVSFDFVQHPDDMLWELQCNIIRGSYMQFKLWPLVSLKALPIWTMEILFIPRDIVVELFDYFE